MTTPRLIAAGFMLMVLVGALLLNATHVVDAIGAMLRSGADVATGDLKMRTADDNTTGTLIRYGKATSTLTFASENFSSASVYVQLSATSSPNNSWLQIERQASDNAVDWFTYDTTTHEVEPIGSTGSLALATSSIPMRWKPSSYATSSAKSFNIELIPSRFTRLIFSVGTSTNSLKPDRMLIWANVIGQIAN